VELTSASDLGDLVARARDGEQGAWDDLVDRYLGLVHAICRAHRLAADEAAGVNQLVWLRLVEHLPRLRAPEAVGGWIAATTRHECVRVLRSTGRAVPVDGVAPDSDTEAGDPDGGSIDTGLLVYERDRAVLEAFGRLGGPGRRLLWVMAADPAPTYDEIAAALDMPVDRIGPARGRSLEQLRRLL
jgi:DNA-directed RNA polymerase specialized sigma24 family protein